MRAADPVLFSSPKKTNTGLKGERYKFHTKYIQLCTQKGVPKIIAAKRVDEAPH